MSSLVNARRLAAASLVAAAVVGAAALPASASTAGPGRPDRQKVEISDVQYDAPGRDTRSARSLNGEWVELTNTSRHSVNLDGWTLEDEAGNVYAFDHYRLAGRATVRIHTGEGRDTRTDLYQDLYRHIWDNRRDTATLRNDRDRTIDKVSWGHRHGGGHHQGGQHR